MQGVKVFELPDMGDERGHLVVAEGDGKLVPFSIKRMFYIFGGDLNCVRGKHANRKSQFFMISLKGSCKVRVDNGREEEIIALDSPTKGLYLDKMLWKDMYDFSSDSILLILSSEFYDGKEYIREYGEYQHEVKKMGI